MTYLELINGVLRRLRETTVSTADENTYSSLIGELVNDAKKQVQNSHEWTALRSVITFPTVVSTTTYTLTGAKQDSILKQAMNDTTNQYLHERNLKYFNDNVQLSTGADGSPTDFMISGTNSSGELQVRVYPTPDKIETLRFDMIVPQADLSSDATELTIPSNPVLQLAFGMALRERGETGGMSAAEQFAIANDALNDAIALDANRYRDELYYYAV